VRGRQNLANTRQVRLSPLIRALPGSQRNAIAMLTEPTTLGALLSDIYKPSWRCLNINQSQC